MSLQQFAVLIPVLLHLEMCTASRQVDTSDGCHRLVVALRGHITVAAADGEPVVVGQGYACHPQQGPFVIRLPRTKAAEYAVITYRLLPEEGEWTLSGPLRTHSEVKIKYMLDELVRLPEETGALDDQEAAVRHIRKRLMLERILFIFIKETGMMQDKKPSAVLMDETLSYISEHYMLKLTLSMLAQRAGLSEGHFTVLFKQRTGMTMVHYLRMLRIQKAKEMFRQTGLSAKEVAGRVGFSDYFHFSRIFKKEVGCAPSEYSKQHENI